MFCIEKVKEKKERADDEFRGKAKAGSTEPPQGERAPPVESEPEISLYTGSVMDVLITDA